MASHFRPLVWMLLFLGIVSAPASAQDFTLTVLLPASGCQWTGPVDVEEPVATAGCDLAFTGSMALPRVAGAAPACPPVLGGSFSGTALGSNIAVGLVSTDFGTVNFAGTIAPGGQMANGTWVVGALSGMWFAEADVDVGGGTADLTMTRPADGCEWTGPITATGGLTFAGSLALTRMAGAPPCPDTVSGPIQGTLFGTALCFELMSTALGDVTFTGKVNVPARSAAGTWMGDVAGVGTWTAQVGRPAVRAPALGGIALAVLSIALVVAGVRTFRRRTV